jgi:hypothetical protein
MSYQYGSHEGITSTSYAVSTLLVDVKNTAVEAFVSVGPNFLRSYRKAADSEINNSGRTDDRLPSPYLLSRRRVRTTFG